MFINILGAGLAGCEAAYQVSKRGVRVRLFEMKPHKMTPAHKSSDFCELICSNSLKAARVESAAGLLKEDENADEYSDTPLYEFFENAGFDYGESVIGDDTVVLGMKPDEMKDDETLAQFKQRVVEKLKAANIPVGGVGDIKLITGVDSDGDIMFD